MESLCQVIHLVRPWSMSWKKAAVEKRPIYWQEVALVNEGGWMDGRAAWWSQFNTTFSLREIGDKIWILDTVIGRYRWNSHHNLSTLLHTSALTLSEGLVDGVTSLTQQNIEGYESPPTPHVNNEHQRYLCDHHSLCIILDRNWMTFACWMDTSGWHSYS